MNHEAMSTISVFRVKFTVLSRMSLKETKHTLSERTEKEKAISVSTVNSQRTVIKLKEEAILKTLSVQGQKRVFADVLYSTLFLKTTRRSFTF